MLPSELTDMRESYVPVRCFLELYCFLALCIFVIKQAVSYTHLITIDSDELAEELEVTYEPVKIGVLANSENVENACLLYTSRCV